MAGSVADVALVKSTGVDIATVGSSTNRSGQVGGIDGEVIPPQCTPFSNGASSSPLSEQLLPEDSNTFGINLNNSKFDSQMSTTNPNQFSTASTDAYTSSNLDTAQLDTAVQQKMMELSSTQHSSTLGSMSGNRGFYSKQQQAVPLPNFSSVASKAGGAYKAPINPLQMHSTNHLVSHQTQQSQKHALRSETINATTKHMIPSFDSVDVLKRKNSATERLAALWTSAAASQKYNVQKHFPCQDPVSYYGNQHDHKGGAASSTLSKLDIASVTSFQTGHADGKGLVDFNQKQWQAQGRLSARSNKVIGHGGGHHTHHNHINGLHQLVGGTPTNNYRIPIGLSQLRSKDERLQKARQATPMQHQSIASVSSRMTSLMDDRSDTSSQFSTRVRRQRRCHTKIGEEENRKRPHAQQTKDNRPQNPNTHHRSRSVMPRRRSHNRSPERSVRRRSFSFESSVVDEHERSPRRRHRKQGISQGYHHHCGHNTTASQMYDRGSDPLWFHPPRRAPRGMHTPHYPAAGDVGVGVGAPSLSPVASRSMLTCNREFQRCYPNVYQGLCKGLLDVNRLITQEIVIPVKEEVTLHKSSIRSRWAVTSAISEHLWRAVHGKFPDPKIAPRLVRKVADYLYDKIEGGVQEAEDERSMLQWLMRFDVENGIDVRVTTSMVVGFNSVIANIEGAAHIRRRKGNMMSLVSKDMIMMDVEVVIKALFLNGGQLAEINNDPVFSDIVLAGESRFAAQFILPH
eukprot:Lankesteria_metandrocarpae@DN4262_c0_g1_i1.p1